MRPQNHPIRDFHGAALIDEAGREIPITESMIQGACEQLEDAWHYPNRHHRLSPVKRTRKAG